MSEEVKKETELRKLAESYFRGVDKAFKMTGATPHLMTEVLAAYMSGYKMGAMAQHNEEDE